MRMLDEEGMIRPARPLDASGKRGGAPRHIKPGSSPRSRRSLLRLTLAQNEGAIDFDYLGLDIAEEREIKIEETTPGEVYGFCMIALANPLKGSSISSDGELDLFTVDGSPWLIGDLGAVRLLNKIILTDETPSDIDPVSMKLRRNDG